MRARGRTFVVLLLVAVLAPAGARAADPGEADVRRALDGFIDALNNLRWDDFRAWFADDVTLFNPEIPEVASLGLVDGREAVEKSFRRVFDEARKHASGPPYMHMAPRNVRVQMLDGASAAVATFELDRDGGTIGRRTFVYRKTPEGWRIVHIHASNTSKRE
ncbi:MAG TPA: nuclear transport factor 2 family protein [Thermoanaerobaculia bacterium]|jgi:ketosteroid isomerase-like protein|nr:nuclear transport factor 2 family protein [Thermoanaerobaculia bacterium]